MSQSLSSVLVHLVFSTKNRQPIIASLLRDELHRYIGGICRNMKSPLLCAGGMEDHVHCLVCLARTVCVSDLMEKVKTGTSKWMKEKGVAGFYWQSGFGAFSIGKSAEQELRDYITDQSKRHAVMTFQDEYRLFLRRYEIEFDEMYVWD